MNFNFLNNISGTRFFLVVVVLLAFYAEGYSQENSSVTCTDGIDNDGDGLIDCEDGDCQQICIENLLGECVTIDFETVLGNTPETQTPIQNQYLGQGVQFSLSNGDLPILVDYGGAAEAFNGNGADMPQPEFEAELGGFFITDDGQSGGADAFTIILDFQLPVLSISGQILDIDYQETFEARAYDEFGALVTSVEVTNQSPNTGNGIPTSWEILADDFCIWSVELEGNSNSTISFGYGLDNFEFCYGEIEDLCQCASEEADSPWLQSICSGCTDPTACNYNSLALFDNEECVYPDGCVDSSACNYDSNAQCDDGSCLYGIGCTDPQACNYDSTAECDGNCIYPDGCTDSLACNYLANAQCDDGSCIYPDGCTDPGACNYDSTAECNDGSCEYGCLGCTDPLACNYDSDPEITVDDGSCTFPGCTNPEACNFNWQAGCEDGSCILPDGCTASNACNYNPEALCDNGTCDFISCADCAGNPFGSAEIDTCGVCLLPSDPLWNFSCIGQLYVPNSFTPNGDNLNDVWQIETARFLYRYEVKVFNRWGEQIFHSQDISEPWMGNDQNGEHYVEDGIYSYVIVYSFSPGEIREKTGVITVFR